MVELRKQKLEAVVMLDKIKIIQELTEKKYFVLNTFKPFHPLAINFILDFSNELKKKKKIYKYPDLMYLILWTSKKKIEQLVKVFNDNDLRIGRGLVFHICPSNVPTNFIYSFFFGLLSGNSNIVKVPSKDFTEKNIILEVINFLFKKKKYLKLKESNFFIEYRNSIENTNKLSSICDARVLWGGDETIKEIRKIAIPERTIEVTFPDRYSISIINSDQLKKEKFSNIKLLANKFFYDSYSSNQLACNSPHFVFWVGNKNIKIQNFFWNKLNKIVEKKFFFDDIHIVDKYTNLIGNIILQNGFKNIKTYKNNLYVIDFKNKNYQIENVRGVNGTFFQINISNIKKLKKFISQKCQTVSYYGFSKKELEFFILNNQLRGIDRIVPIGKALGIDIKWDGYDIIKTLSRVITIE